MTAQTAIPSKIIINLPTDIIPLYPREPGAAFWYETLRPIFVEAGADSQTMNHLDLIYEQVSTRPGEAAACKALEEFCFKNACTLHHEQLGSMLWYNLLVDSSVRNQGRATNPENLIGPSDIDSESLDKIVAALRFSGKDLNDLKAAYEHFDSAISQFHDTGADGKRVIKWALIKDWLDQESQAAARTVREVLHHA